MAKNDMEARDIAILQTDVQYIKKQNEEIYIELKLMRDRFPRREELIEAIKDQEKEHADIREQIKWIKVQIWAAALAIIGLAYKVFEKFILQRV